jgi:outer membrane protein insertion porin family
VAFQRYNAELRGYAPLGQLGGRSPGSQPLKFVLGLSARAGTVFGNTGPFFFQQQFALGGVQFGEQLRGYPEFSITPQGYNVDVRSFESSPQAFGKAFLAMTAEFGLRVSQQFYVNAFYDAGNNWSRASQFDPTRLFRGAGVGLNVITPLGPLGLDWAYGFDRLARDPVTNQVRPDPRWQLHFRLGQLF